MVGHHLLDSGLPALGGLKFPGSGLCLHIKVHLLLLLLHGMKLSFFPQPLFRLHELLLCELMLCSSLGKTVALSLALLCDTLALETELAATYALLGTGRSGGKEISGANLKPWWKLRWH
jgi:hypothetical protein